MNVAKVVWSIGVAIIVAAVIYGVLWAALTDEPLASTLAPSLTAGVALALLITGVAVVWSVLHPPALPSWMMAVTGLVAVVAVLGAPMVIARVPAFVTMAMAVLVLGAVGWGVFGRGPRAA